MSISSPSSPGFGTRLSHSPVAFPGMPHVGVMNVVLVSLLIQEVEHVFDGQGKRTATVSSAEDGLKEVVYKFLESALLGEGEENVRYQVTRG